MRKSVVAIVGRPNVGKSTIFNRITRTRNAIVDNFPGVTRDRIFGKAVWDDDEFTIVDTGGFLETDKDEFACQIRLQVEQAIKEADVIVLILDGKGGPSPFDIDLIKILRSTEKPVFFAVNKIDEISQENRLYDFYSLGIENFYPVSGEHGYGISDLLDDIVKVLPKNELDQPLQTDLIKLAVVGRPNVGKSSLINRILGEKRMVVSDMPGTTRDSVDIACNVGGKSYLLIDTAGIRRKAKVNKKIEKFSIIRALKSLDKCDIALILMDASEGITEQDITIIGHAYERGCGCILLINKWDLVKKDGKKERQFFDELKMESKFVNFAPALTVSALTGLRIPKIFSMVETIYSQYTNRIGTGQLNKIISSVIEKNEPPMHKGRRIKFYYATQVGIKPPTFIFFVNYPEAVHFSYERFLINQIRQEADMAQTPIRLFFRERKRRD